MNIALIIIGFLACVALGFASSFFYRKVKAFIIGEFDRLERVIHSRADMAHAQLEARHGHLMFHLKEAGKIVEARVENVAKEVGVWKADHDTVAADHSLKVVK